MPRAEQHTTFRGFGGCVVVACVMPGLSGCSGMMPSSRLQTAVDLPIPESALTVPSSERLFGQSDGEKYPISPRSLIALAFSLQPDIKSSFGRFKSEESRYDFFYTSRDSLTPRLRLRNEFEEFRVGKSTTREREHTVEVSLEKRFFDTTELNVGVGYDTQDLDDDIGNHAFLSADLRYPLWASREKLERASEDIFRRNELDDTQLAYIQEVRRRLQDALFRFHDVDNLRRTVENYTSWLHELESLASKLDGVKGRNVTNDRRRLDAERARVGANRRNVAGRYQIQQARLKAAIGLPFHVDLQLVDEPFNPFQDSSHEELLRLSIETDPEIATLRNAVRNSEVQLDLAKRGRWDIALLLSGSSNLEGRGGDEGTSDWTMSIGLDISAVDARVTDSLTRQAQANINRFRQAMAARENTIFTDTLEPLVRIDTLGTSREELIKNLPRYANDYISGVAAYLAGTLNIDDLLKRRENLFDQENEISRLTFLVGANVAELCSATGKFFELLNGDSGS